MVTQQQSLCLLDSISYIDILHCTTNLCPETQLLELLH